MGQYTSKNTFWEISHSLWVVCSIVPFFNWAGFVYAAIRTKKLKFIAVALCSTAIFAATIFCIASLHLYLLATIIFLVSYVAGIAISVNMMGDYLRYISDEEPLKYLQNFNAAQLAVSSANALPHTLGEFDAFKKRMDKLLPMLDVQVVKEKAYTTCSLIHNLHTQSPNNSLLYGYINNFEGILVKFNELEDAKGISDELKKNATEKVCTILDSGIQSLEKELHTIYTNKISDFNTDLQTFNTDLSIRSGKN